MVTLSFGFCNPSLTYVLLAITTAATPGDAALNERGNLHSYLDLVSGPLFYSATVTGPDEWPGFKQ